eukprot:289395-Pleurochrysis_carterae.AAC.2
MYHVYNDTGKLYTHGPHYTVEAIAALPLGGEAERRAFIQSQGTLWRTNRNSGGGAGESMQRKAFKFKAVTLVKN